MTDEPKKNTVIETWKEFGSLINTGVIVVSFLGMFVTAGFAWNDTSRDIEANKSAIDNFKIEHSLYHKEKAEENAKLFTVLNERVRTLEESSRKYERLSDKVATTDANLSGLAQSVKELILQFNNYAGDLREVKVILQRMEQQRRG